MDKEKLYEKAKAAFHRAYAPYSQFPVGSAVVGDSGEVYTGCNVENASYGATNCAERVAIQNAISQGNKRVTELLLVTDTEPAAPPCSICRQVLVEFCDADTPIHLANLKGIQKTLTVSDLVPMGFLPVHLKRDSV